MKTEANLGILKTFDHNCTVQEVGTVLCDIRNTPECVLCLYSILFTFYHIHAHIQYQRGLRVTLQDRKIKFPSFIKHFKPNPSAKCGTEQDSKAAKPQSSRGQTKKHHKTCAKVQSRERESFALYYPAFCSRMFRLLTTRWKISERSRLFSGRWGSVSPKHGGAPCWTKQ